MVILGDGKNDCFTPLGPKALPHRKQGKFLAPLRIADDWVVHLPKIKSLWIWVSNIDL